MTDNISESTPGSGFSRRQFLKTGSMLAMALAFTRRKEKKESSEIVKIETTSGNFYPIYERHDSPLEGEELEEMPRVDLIFYESALTASKDLQALSPEEIVNKRTRRTDDRAYLIPRDHLPVIRRNNSLISLEGFSIVGGWATGSIFGQLGEFVGGALALKAALSKKAPLGENRYVSGRAQKALLGLLGAWATPRLPIGIALSAVSGFEMTNVKQSAALRLVERINAWESHAHPEDKIIFFRNLMMARSLLFLSRYIERVKGRRAEITYNVGMGHAGIEDFLRAGEEFVTYMIKITPDSLFEKLVEVNGGVESLCSLVVVSPNPNNPTKEVILDKELKEIIESKIG